MLKASPPLTQGQAIIVRAIYDDMLDHQRQWYFDKTPEEQHTAISLFESSQRMWVRYHNAAGKTHTELRTILPDHKWLNPEKENSSKIWCITIMLIISVCKHGRKTMTKDDRMNFARLARIGQQSNRIWMNGYEELYHPKYDV